MHAQIYLDPRIRDFVFIPLVLLMAAMQTIRIVGMRYMNEPKNKLLEPASLAYKTLHGTYFEADADVTRELPEGEIDITKSLEEVDINIREGAALKRSLRLRKISEFMPEHAMKTRKAFFCDKNNGYFHKKVATGNPMNMMTNPDMMNNMLKQNVQSVIHMMMFTVIGNIFQGFITAQVPFPLGHKFKQMLQQGLNVVALDPTYTSSMSWSFLLVYGLNGILGLMLADQKTIEEMEKMSSGAAMMAQGNSMQPKNYTNLFKAEREFYEILNYKFALDDVEDAFLMKYK